MRAVTVFVLSTLVISGCTSLAPRSTRPLVVIEHTNGGVVSISDRTEVDADGRVYTSHRSLWGRTLARRTTLSPPAMKQLRDVLEGPEFTNAVEVLAPLTQRCGTREEDTVSVQYLRQDDIHVGFCVNDADVPPDVLRLLDQLEAPLIRELGERYVTRAGARVRATTAPDSGLEPARSAAR